MTWTGNFNNDADWQRLKRERRGPGTYVECRGLRGSEFRFDPATNEVFISPEQIENIAANRATFAHQN